MDTGTHLIFGTTICHRLSISEDYACWSLAPDMDLDTGVHRYTHHRIACLAEIEAAYRNTHPNAPTEDKQAIAALIASHLYLDMFAGPVWCWGSLFPAMHTPPQIILEYKNRNYYLVPYLSQEAVANLHDSSQQIFELELPASFTAAEFVAYVLQELARASYAGSFMRKRALKPVTRYMVVPVPSSFKSYLTNAYYRYLNEFFGEH